MSKFEISTELFGGGGEDNKLVSTRFEISGLILTNRNKDNKSVVKSKVVGELRIPFASTEIDIQFHRARSLVRKYSSLLSVSLSRLVKKVS